MSSILTYRNLDRHRLGWVTAESVVSRIEGGTSKKLARIGWPSRILKRNYVGDAIRGAIVA